MMILTGSGVILVAVESEDGNSGDDLVAAVSRRGVLWGAVAMMTLAVAGCDEGGPARPARASGPASESNTPGPARPGVAGGPATSARVSRTGPGAVGSRPTRPGRRGGQPSRGGPQFRAEPYGPADSPVRSLGDYVRRTPGAAAFAHNAVMLTIDDGPDPVWTPKILRLLAKYDVSATFCIIGTQALAHPKLVKAGVSEGHHLANHTHTHPLGLTRMSHAAMSGQIIDAQDAIVRASGFTPRQFRSPGGSWSPAMMALTRAHDLLAIDWDVDPRDWSRPGTTQVVAAMLAAQPGDVLLCHDGGGDRSQTYTALKTVLPRLKARGLQFVTLPCPQPATR